MYSCHQKGYSFYTFYVFWLETQQESSAVADGQRPSAGRIPCYWRRTTFVLGKPSLDWMRPTHIMECNLLHSNLNINLNLIVYLIQKDAHTAAPRIVLDQTSDPAEPTHTINHRIQEAGRGWPGMGMLSAHR